jgi:acetyltransferase-like isoleucine patch superfamily enzyme
MKQADVVQSILFDYEGMTTTELRERCKGLSWKIVRWLGANHPDNKTRKLFFELTNVEIGEDTVINPGFVVSDGRLPLLRIGKRVAVSPNVTIVCESAPNNSVLGQVAYVRDHLIQRLAVVIEDDVWLGANVVILPGVTVGARSIVGAGAVVTRNVPRDVVASGVPARVTRPLTEGRQREKS